MKVKKLIPALSCLAVVLTLLSTTALAAETERFTLGSFDMATKTYKDATGSGAAKYHGISVCFSLEIAGGESITLPPDENGFVYRADLSSDYSKVINMTGGKTAAEIAEYVRKIRFDGSDAGQTVSVLLSDAAIEHNTFYWGGNDHFYQYVTGNTPWTTAYTAAKGMTYNGRSGYLATVSSKAEDQFIRTVSNEIGWLGGTRLSIDTTAEGYNATDWKTWTFNPNNSAGYWYWACGPEAANGAEASKFYTAATYSAAADHASSAAGYYFNWDRGGEPNSNGNECCLATLTQGIGYATQTYGYSWNDLTIGGNNGGQLWWAQGYFVEYGDQSHGDSGGSGGVTTGSLTSDGDVSESFPAWATAAGLTNGTVATWRGRPLPSVLTLNEDVALPSPIALPGGVNVALDLNGHTITAPSGEPAITSSGAVNLTISCGSGSGRIIGSNGANGTTGDGASGTPAISLQGSGRITVSSGVTINGGSGGDASPLGGNGGSGACAIAGYAAVTANSGASIIGGNGGNAAISPGVGGTGGAAADGWNNSGSGTFTDGVNGTTPPNITTTSLPDGATSAAYDQSLSALGDAPITWTIESGSLPAGITFSAGQMTGMPTATGTFRFTVKAVNGTGSDTQELTLIIAQNLLAAPTGLAWDTTIPAKAVWTAVEHAASYSVQLYKGGTALGMPVSVTTAFCDFTSQIAPPNYEDRYTFKVMAVGEYPNYGNSTWSAASASRTAIRIAFFGNGGAGSMPNAVAFSGFSFTLPACSFTPPFGKQFKEWRIEWAGGAQANAGDTYTFSWPSYVYAMWEDAPTYPVAITLLKDGAAYTGQMIQLQQGAGGVVPLTEGTSGVYTGAVPADVYAITNGMAATGQSVTVTAGGGSATLNFYTVSFEANGGTPAPTAQVVMKDGLITVPAAVTNGDDIFGGWYASSAFAGAEWDFVSDAVTATTTLHAKWTSNTNDPPASDNIITGVTAGESYTLGDTVSFTAVGGGMSNTAPNTGDRRWLPTAWATNPSGIWSGAPYSASFSTTGMSLGSHTLTVTFAKQRYNGAAWASLSPAVTDQKSVGFTLVAGPAPMVPPVIDPPDTAQDRTITVVAGNTATLSITAEGATSYQWYKSINGGAFSPIDGGMGGGSSYTTSPVSMANNGYRYCCVATNSAGSTRSCIFVLNVIEQPYIPATGDNAQLALWLGIILMAGAVLTVNTALHRRNPDKARNIS